MLSNDSQMTNDRPPLPDPQDSPFPIKDPGGILSDGHRWAYRIQNGFWISRLDIESRQQIRLAYEKDRPTLNFGFILAGNYINRIKAPGLSRQEFSNHEGTSGILYLPRQEGELIIPGRTLIRVVHVHLSLPVFYDLFQVDRETVPDAFKPLMEGPVDRSCIYRAGMSMGMQSTLHRLVEGPSPETPALLFYQGIALDLIAGQINRANTQRRFPRPLPFDDHDRVVRARDLLIQNLSAPPCLKQLSRKTGLNMNKLQQGFYQLYGVSVFRYLHQYRMQEANRIFHETDMNVSQAASAVGYTNVSHFSRAYKKQFNILPKKHLTCIKN